MTAHIRLFAFHPLPMTDLRDKLRRLGVHKGATHLRTPPHSLTTMIPGESLGIESFVDGRPIDTPYGPAFVHEDVFSTDHLHGDHTLGELLSVSPAAAAQIANEDALAQVDLSRVVFLDTETTGLGGGTGTLVFLVGLGAFDVSHSSFVLRQFFLRTPAEELAMLHALAERLDAFDAVVSFNGRGFDMPLLESRFTLARMRPRILRAPHLDLLMPARRVWRGRLPSCALSSLEHHILNVQREQADVPGYLIPEMYVHYVRTGDASEMPRVLYHNMLDILSMVSLSTRLINLFAQASPLSPSSLGGMQGRALPDPADLLALGKWYDDLGRTADAESALRNCLACRPDPATRFAALHRLGAILKRAGRREEAVRVWAALSESQTAQGIEACIELAKHCEWDTANLDRASVWTREAMAIAQALPDGYARSRYEAELSHRLERLMRKRRAVSVDHENTWNAGFSRRKVPKMPTKVGDP